MAKAKSKTQQKTKGTPKKGKISKKSVSKQTLASKNPRRVKQPSKKTQRTPQKRSYYTIGQDAIIMDRLANMKQENTITELANDLSNQFGKSHESIRDRIKRYLKKLSPADQKIVLKEAKKNPNQYIHFKKTGEVYKRIEKISSIEPSMHNNQMRKKVKKTPKGKKVTKNQYEWLINKLENKDPYFSVDLGVQLLNSLFEELVEQGKATRNQINDYVRGVNSDVTLKDVFAALNVN